MLEVLWCVAQVALAAPERFPSTYALGAAIGLGRRDVYSALDFGRPADSQLGLYALMSWPLTPWFAIGFDTGMETTTTRTEPAGDPVWPDGGRHVAVGGLATLWAKPFWSFDGVLRPWAGVGVNGGFVSTTYYPGESSIFVGTDSDLVASVSLGVGLDARADLKGKTDLVGCLALHLGAPPYDEDIPGLLDGEDWTRDNVAHLANPVRLLVGAGIAR